MCFLRLSAVQAALIQAGSHGIAGNRNANMSGI
jgi:hypothetical protein